MALTRIKTGMRQTRPFPTDGQVHDMALRDALDGMDLQATGLDPVSGG